MNYVPLIAFKALTYYTCHFPSTVSNLQHHRYLLTVFDSVSFIARLLLRVSNRFDYNSRRVKITFIEYTRSTY